MRYALAVLFALTVCAQAQVRPASLGWVDADAILHCDVIAGPENLLKGWANAGASPTKVGTPDVVSYGKTVGYQLNGSSQHLEMSTSPTPKPPFRSHFMAWKQNSATANDFLIGANDYRVYYGDGDTQLTMSDSSLTINSPVNTYLDDGGSYINAGAHNGANSYIFTNNKSAGTGTLSTTSDVTLNTTDFGRWRPSTTHYSAGVIGMFIIWKSPQTEKKMRILYEYYRLVYY